MTTPIQRPASTSDARKRHAEQAQQTPDAMVLTVRQPWAWSIVHGGKDVENRTRNIAGHYRGPVAIHVAQAPACRIGEHLVVDDFDFERDRSGYLARSDRFAWPYRLPYAEGHVIGVVDLTEVHHGEDCWNGVALLDGTTHTELCTRWALADRWHISLANPRPLATPIPAKGRLGLWRPDPGLLAAITEQIGAEA